MEIQMNNMTVKEARAKIKELEEFIWEAFKIKDQFVPGAIFFWKDSKNPHYVVLDYETGKYKFGGVGGNPLCLFNGHWETKDEMIEYIVDTDYHYVGSLAYKEIE
jgi:hypothetical protein